MVKHHALWSIFILSTIYTNLAVADQAVTKPVSANAILDKIDDLYRGKSSHGQMTMKVVTKHWTRELKMDFWSKGEEQTLIRVLSPLKEKGTATLKSGNNIWNYLPKVKRTIKIPSSMMGSSWMGSHFTNNDLVKEHRMAQEYNAEISGAADPKEQQTIEITAIPKPNAPVVWGKVVAVVRSTDLMPQRVHYFKENMELARTISFSDLHQVDGRTIPFLMRIVPADKPEESTEVRYTELDFNKAIPDDTFSLRRLRR